MRMVHLERQLTEVVRVAEKYGVVFNIEKIEVGSEMVYVGMLIRCQENGPPLFPRTPKMLRHFKQFQYLKTGRNCDSS